MMDIKEIRKNPERFKKAARDKHLPVDIDRLLEIDAGLQGLKKELQRITTEKNRLSKLMLSLSGDDKAKALNKLKAHKKNETDLGWQIKPLQAEFDNLMLYVSQPPDDDVLIGKDDKDNVEVRRWAPNKCILSINSSKNEVFV